MDNGHPVTKSEMQAALDALKHELTDELQEFMRQIETNILTAFHGYARGVTAHLRTPDTACLYASLRLLAIEEHLAALETSRPPPKRSPEARPFPTAPPQ